MVRIPRANCTGGSGERVGEWKMFGLLPSCSCCCSSFSSRAPPPHMNTREHTVSLVWTQNNTRVSGVVGGRLVGK